jgi:hypothetical protein
MALTLAPALAQAQDVLTIQELELQYTSRVQQHEAAYAAWEALESRFIRALDSLTAATTSGNADRQNAAFTLTQQLGEEIQLQERRVAELAGEVEEARTTLLGALKERLDSLIVQVEATEDPQERRELTAILDDRNNRYLALRAEEDPETTLEPMREMTIDPRDTPEIIFRKAETLDLRGDRYESQMAEVGQRLEALREDQRRARTVRDFVAGVERYDDTRLPVVSPGGRPGTAGDPSERPTGADSLGVDTSSMTLEERIESLERVQGELEQRLLEIRGKADRFREVARRRGG